MFDAAARPAPRVGLAASVGLHLLALALLMTVAPAPTAVPVRAIAAPVTFWIAPARNPAPAAEPSTPAGPAPAAPTRSVAPSPAPQLAARSAAPDPAAEPSLLARPALTTPTTPTEPAEASHGAPNGPSEDSPDLGASVASSTGGSGHGDSGNAPSTSGPGGGGGNGPHPLGDAATRSRLSRLPDRPYPATAQEAGVAGVVTVRLFVGPAGAALLRSDPRCPGSTARRPRREGWHGRRCVQSRTGPTLLRDDAVVRWAAATWHPTGAVWAGIVEARYRLE